MNTEFINIQPLRYWVQRVLPLVYDDSLSYMELLNKVVYKLNELIENNKLLPDYIADLIKEYISSGAIEKVLAEILADYMLNVKFPPEGLIPATGDGSADDTEAIQGCINYAHEHGGMAVYFPSGSYLTQSLTIYDKTTMFGYDRYNTRLVLKGGATQPLLTGTSNELTLTGLSFDGNMDIQVNNIILIDINVNSGIITNCLLTDGYELLKVNVSSDLQIDNIIFDHAVVRGLDILGLGIVEAKALIFNSVSSLLGADYILLDNSNSVLEDIHFIGASPNGLQVNGSNNIIKFFKGSVVTPYIDNGINNSIEVYTESKVDKVTGNVTVGIGGSYAETVSKSKVENIIGDKELRTDNYVLNINGDCTSSFSQNITNTVYGNAESTIMGNVNNDIEGLFTEKLSDKVSLINGSSQIQANSSSEIITGQKTIKSHHLFLDPLNPIKYSKEININRYFNGVPFVDIDDNPYFALTKFLTNVNFINLLDYGAKGDGITDDSDAITNAILEAINKNTALFIPPVSSFYKITKTITINMDDNQHVFIFGLNNPLIKKTTPGTETEDYAFIFRPTQTNTNTSVYINNIAIDCSGTVPSWTETDLTQLKYVTAIYNNVNLIELSNINFSNIYGYCIKVAGFDFCNISNCQFHQIGGRWSSYGLGDGFGDGIYLFSNKINSVCNINNCNINAYELTSDNRTSRCGITLEYEAKGECNINNCKIKTFMRSIHIEVANDVTVNVNNVLFDTYTVGIFNSTLVKLLTVNNCRFINGNDYNVMNLMFPIGSILNDNKSNIVFNNCYIEMSVNGRTVLEVDNIVFENCVFVNTNPQPIQVEFYNCYAKFINCVSNVRFYFNKSYTIELINCNFNSFNNNDVLLASENTDKLRINNTKFYNTRWYISNVKSIIVDNNSFVFTTTVSNAGDINLSWLAANTTYIESPVDIVPYFNFNNTSTIYQIGTFIKNINGTVSIEKPPAST